MTVRGSHKKKKRQNGFFETKERQCTYILNAIYKNKVEMFSLTDPLIYV